MKFLVFAASHRPDSLNRKLAQAAARQLQQLGASIDFVEYDFFDAPIYNDQLHENGTIPKAAYALSERAKGTSGLVIASPEYNWSYPGSLKNIIDWTSRIDKTGLSDKTAFLLSATPGSRGGISGLQHLKTPLEAIGLHVYGKMFPLGRAESAFNAQGQLDAKNQTQLNDMLAGYLKYTQKLHAMS